MNPDALLFSGLLFAASLLMIALASKPSHKLRRRLRRWLACSDTDGSNLPFPTAAEWPFPPSFQGDPSLAALEPLDIPAFLRATPQSPLQVLATDPKHNSELAHAYESLQVLANHAEGIADEHSRLLEALQDAVILLRGRPAEWKQLSTEYGIDPNSNTLPASLKSAALREFEQLISEVLAGEPAKAVAA